MAEVNPAETIAGQTDQAFKHKVEELSEGSLSIDIHFSASLGDVEKIMSMMISHRSSVHILRMSAQNLAPYGCNKTALLSIPYTFSNKAHFWSFANSKTAETILAEPMEIGLGVKGLFFAEEGFRHFFSVHDISGVEDFKGLNIRGTNDLAMQGLIKSLNANSINVNFVDLYSALQSGTVEVAEQPIANYLANHFYEVAPYMILDGHTLGVMEPIITLEAWNSLSENQQQILMKAGMYAQDFCRKLSLEEETRVRKHLESLGVKITDVSDIAPWQEACSDLIKASSAVDSRLYAQILNRAH